MLWRRKWQPTPVLLPGKSHGQRSLVGYSPWGCKDSDMTEWLHFHFHFHFIYARHYFLLLFYFLKETCIFILFFKKNFGHAMQQVGSFIYIYIFILYNLFGCAQSLLLSGVFSSCGEGGYSSLWCMGFSLQWLLLWARALGCMGSVVVAPGL